MLLDKVRKTIEENALLENGDKVICAVSGGADSVCLLHIIRSLKKEYNLSVYVANVNHLIRGEESDRDSNFVKSVCRAADVECFYREYDVVNIAKERKIGEEECGRILRYEFFEELSEKLGGAKIATAHNLNDNAETVLFRLIRGSSAEGLGGIKYKRDNIIRPLLDIERDEIESYLKRNGITWCEDSTNKIPVYARNKLRLSVIPQLNEISKGAEKKVVSAAKLIYEDSLFLSEMSQRAESECFFGDYLLADKLFDLENPIKRRVASGILKKWCAKEITADKIEKFIAFLSKESGKQFDINKDFYAEKSYSRVYLKNRNSNESFHQILDFQRKCIYNNWEIILKQSTELIKKKSNNVAVFDLDKVSPPFEVRYRKEGDKIYPKGLNGTKKVSDIFSDEKIDRHLRDTIPIVEKNGEILFVCGLRQSSLYAADSTTKNYLVIEYIKNTEEKFD